MFEYGREDLTKIAFTVFSSAILGAGIFDVVLGFDVFFTILLTEIGMLLALKRFVPNIFK